MGLNISKCYSSYRFYPIWANLYDKYGSHIGEYKVMHILVICQKNLKFCGTLKYNIAVYGKILKCAIS